MAQQLSSLVQNTLAVDVTNITGTIPVLKGGTGATTAAAALTNLGAYAASNPSGYTTNTGTVTSVAALTLGTTGTDFTSTVATGTTTPAITLNVPTASASNRGALSAADWTTFNSKLGSYTETDTLASVTARGATTTVVPTFSNGATINGNTVIAVTDNTNAALRITQLGTGDALLVEDSTNPDASPFVISAVGTVVVGNQTPITTIYDPQTPTARTIGFQKIGTESGAAGIAAISYSSNGGNAPFYSPAYYLARSKSAIKGTPGVVADGDVLGSIVFSGDDGTNFVSAAQIRAYVDGTPGTNDMPGRLTFNTTADGASSPTERMRIDSSGNVGIGTTSPVGKLHVQQTTDGTLLRLQRTGGSNIPILQVNLTESTNLVEFEATGAVGASITFKAGATERMRISSAGAVSIPGTLGVTGKVTTLAQVETPDVTSLLTTANTYPTTRPSLNLDFANSATLDPRITFTRGTNATYTGSDGLVKNTAGINSPRFDWDPVTRECKGLLIEEARTNLLAYSEDSSIYHWLENASIAINQTISPNGNTNANKIVSTLTGGSNTCYVQKTSTVASNTETYTFSIFVKAGTSPTTTLNLSLGGGTYQQAVGIVTWATNTISTGTLINYGNGWYKASITLTNNATNTVLTGRIYVKDQSTANVSGEYGYLWGWQLEAGAFATSYIPSSVTWTGRASTATYVGSNGLIQTAASGVARYQYNPTNLSVAPFLLLEPAATNLLTYSEQFDNANWAKARGTVTANALVAPNGTTSGDTFAGNGESGGTQSVFQAVTASASTAYVISVFAKAGTTNWITLQGFDGTTVPRAWFNISAGTVGTVESGMSNGQIVSMGNGWFRCSVVRTTGASATSLRSQFGLAASDGNEATESFLTMSLWGIQVETGSVATSYIPTVASQVTRIADTSTSAQTTRSADVATMTNSNFSSWYNQTEGTMIINVAVPYPAAYSGYTYMLGSFNDGIYHYRQSDSQSVVRIRVGSTDQFGALGWGATWATTAINKNALTYKLNDFNAANNGGAPGSSDTSGIVPTVNALTIGSNNGSSYINGTIAKLTYYPTRLSNSTLQALTT